MNAFNYRDGELFAEGVALSAIAERYGTPTYVYSRAHIEAQYRSYADALQGTEHLVCFAVKANSNLGVLNVLARLGAGFDIVSGGELERVLAAGGRADRVVFSGVGKTREDMRRALEVGVHCFNVESTDELERLQVVAAEMGKVAPVSLRVNPDVDAGTHPYISTGLKENKFGIAIADAEAIYVRAAQLPNLEVVGVDCHIGSQLTTVEPFLDALDRLLVLVDRLAECGIHLRHLDLGGGVGVRYRDEQPPRVADYIKAIRERVGERDLALVFEPGRYIVANSRRAADPRGIPQAHRTQGLRHHRCSDERPDPPGPVPGLDGCQRGQATCRRRPRLRPGRPYLRDWRLPRQGPRPQPGRR